MSDKPKGISTGRNAERWGKKEKRRGDAPEDQGGGSEQSGRGRPSPYLEMVRQSKRQEEPVLNEQGKEAILNKEQDSNPVPESASEVAPETRADVVESGIDFADVSGWADVFREKVNQEIAGDVNLARQETEGIEDPIQRNEVVAKIEVAASEAKTSMEGLLEAFDDAVDKINNLDSEGAKPVETTSENEFFDVDSDGRFVVRPDAVLRADNVEPVQPVEAGKGNVKNAEQVSLLEDEGDDGSKSPEPREPVDIDMEESAGNGEHVDWKDSDEFDDSDSSKARESSEAAPTGIHSDEGAGDGEHVRWNDDEGVDDGSKLPELQSSEDLELSENESEPLFEIPLINRPEIIRPESPSVDMSRVLTSKNAGLFERLGTRAREFAGDIYRDVKLKTVDRMAMARDRKLYECVDSAVGVSEGKLLKLDNDIVKSMEQLKQFDEAYKQMHESRGGDISKGVQGEAAKERKGLEQKIVTLQKNKETAKRELNEKMNARLEYGQKIEELQERIGVVVKEKVEPHLEQARDLVDLAETYQKEIDTFKSDISECQSELDALEAQLGREGIFNFERREMNDRRKEIKLEMKKSEALLKSRETKHRDITTKLSKVNGKVKYWADFKASFEQGKPDHAQNSVQRERINGVASRRYERTSASSVEEPEETLVGVNDYLQLWNDRFGTEMKLDVKKLVDVTGWGWMNNLAHRAEPVLFEKNISDYNASLRRGERMNKKELEANFRTIRRLINKK